jgi:serine/threonine protein kinase
MDVGAAQNEGALAKWPLPLAQLSLRAQNGKNPLERHNAAYFLWEAALKLLGSLLIVEYAGLDVRDAGLSQRLHNLTRPTTADWWEFVRLLLPILTVRKTQFAEIHGLLLGPPRDDLPRLASLDWALRESLSVQLKPVTTVELPSLFDHLVAYRNRWTDQGAPELPFKDAYDAMGRKLLEGISELLNRIDLLAGWQLVYFREARRLESGDWTVEGFSLVGDKPRPRETQLVPEQAASLLPRPKQLYLDSGSSRRMRLHPMVLFEPDTESCYFLNSSQTALDAEYICYSNGAVIHGDVTKDDRRELIESLIGARIDETTLLNSAERSQAEEPSASARNTAIERRMVGEFQLIGRIGRGGMGEVYRAWQPSLGRQVALKVMLRSGDPHAEARFTREIRALGRVEHPNVVKAFASGSHADQWYFAMELVQGVDLAKVCDILEMTSASEYGLLDWRNAVASAWKVTKDYDQTPVDDRSPSPEFVPLTPANRQRAVRAGRGYIVQVVEIMRQIADAAQALHEAGILHRDIKPGNILVTPDSRRAVLTDLGLAQLADESDGRLTRTRQFIGTLRYASPEQILSAGHLDWRTDVYSIGATLYELLTLHPLYGVDDNIPLHELMRKIEFVEPTRPSHHNPSISRDLEAVILKCLEKDRTARYASAGELAADLKRVLTGEPITARRIGTATRAWRWCKRNRVLTALCATIAVAFVGLAASAILVRRAAEARRATNLVRQFEAGIAEPKLDDRYLKQMDELVAKLQEVGADDAAGAPQRVDEKFGQAILDAVHQPRLDENSVASIRHAVERLGQRDARRAAAVQQEFNSRLGQWEPVFELIAPFANVGRVFNSAPLVVDGGKLYWKRSGLPRSDDVLATNVSCSSHSRLEATFSEGWQHASQIGLELQFGDKRGYQFVLSVVDQRLGESKSAAAVEATFADAARDRRSVYLHILRSGQPLRVSELDASRIVTTRLSISAKCDGDLLSAQVNDLPSLDFFDAFPLASAREGVFSAIWPDKVPMERLAAQRKSLGASASPLEKADAFYFHGQIKEARAEYEQQIATSQIPALRQEAQYKVGNCLLADNRASDAMKTFAQLAVEPGDRWPILAALQLCAHHLDRNRMAEADADLQSLMSRYQPDDLAIYFPADLGTRIVRAYDRMGHAHDRDRLDPGNIHTREQLVAVETLMNAPRRQVVLSSLILVKEYLFEELWNRALDKTTELLADPGLTDWARIKLLECYALAMIQRNALDEAQETLNKSLVAADGRRRREYLALLIPLSRVEIAKGRWEAARADIDEYLANEATDEPRRPFSANPDDFADYRAQASLILGWLHEQNGNSPAAQTAWTNGYRRSRKDRRLSYYAAGIMGSLSTELTEEDGDTIVNNAIREQLGNSPFVAYASRAVPRDLIASILRNMWRTRRGRECARRCAYFGHECRRDGETDRMLAAADLLRYSVQGTMDLSKELTAEEDELIWNLCEGFRIGFSNGTISGTQLMQAMLTLAGNNNSVGWQSLAPTVEPRIRGPFAYICGHRYRHLHRPDDAKSFFRIAVDDAPAGSKLRKLAESNLRERPQPPTSQPSK